VLGEFAALLDWPAFQSIVTSQNAGAINGRLKSDKASDEVKSIIHSLVF
jgi:hypothetical protein